jgi:hypothetical protein
VVVVRKDYKEIKNTEEKKMKARYKWAEQIKINKKEERRLRKKLQSTDYKEEED